MWCDFGDNVVLIVSSKPDDRVSSIYRLRAGVKSTDVWVDPNKEGQFVSIQRMRDRVTVHTPERAEKPAFSAMLRCRWV